MEIKINFIIVLFHKTLNLSINFTISIFSQINKKGIDKSQITCGFIINI